MRRILLGAGVLLVLALSLVACGPSAEYSADGPFIRDDPSGLITSASWVPSSGSRLPVDPPTQSVTEPFVVQRDSPSPDVLVFALNGGGCHPHVFVSVVEETPAVELLIEVGESEQKGEVQCTESLKSYQFELVLRREIVPESLNVTVTELVPSAN